MVSVPLKGLAWILTPVALLSACQGEPEEAPHVTSADCAVLGERVRFQEVRGIIYSDIRTRVQISACPNLDMALAFLGDKPPPYAHLAEHAAKAMLVLGFKATGDGYVVREKGGTFTFIALTLDDVAEDPSIARAVKEAKQPAP
jgi:hypothetical protein